MEEAIQTLADALTEHVPDVNVRRKIWADIIKAFDDEDPVATFNVSRTDEIIEEAYNEVHGNEEIDEDEEEPED